MDKYIEAVSYAVINNIKSPLTVIVSLFVIMAAVTAVLVARELKKTE